MKALVLNSDWLMQDFVFFDVKVSVHFEGFLNAINKREMGMFYVLDVLPWPSHPRSNGYMSEMAKAAPGKEIDATLLVTAKNARGIPQVVFIVSLGATAWSFEESSSLYHFSNNNCTFCVSSLLYAFCF